MTERLKTFIRQRATELGFDICRFASAADAWPAGERLRHFVDEGRHGEMEWMETTLERRQHPTAMWNEAKTAIVLGMNYGPEDDPLPQLADRSAGYISVYARGDDYHEVIKGRLKQLAGQIAARNGKDIKVFVDTAPLMEKPLAQRAGLGWQGKHTNLLSRTHGNWLFLGTILTAAEIAPDEPETEHCGRCTACLDACPTKAFPAPFQLDARRCLSYLTIEFGDPWPVEFRRAAGSRIYGCDDCLGVCPWNKFAQEAREIRLMPRDAFESPRLADLLALDDAAFRALFTKSPVKRIGRDRFLRNVLYAVGNSGDAALIAPTRSLLDDASPLVRGAAVWALSQLLAPADFAALRDAANEADPAVQAEWALDAA
ncbi:tRNA epoxyqueuosine(34) reductase QueG [Brevundimonas nasdae]|uniref:tRNA epoxyqueuosine(34) reductase QueG n=1 Tax=Brevundimonas nasdae TaxID=172043 RepID=A0ABX8TQ64_9CAUL|nr:tRNA epoxyqueuosine(34) reductase QueG [Brevundimonas nasdae]QYC12270.1 tRNA epoxyqueuosine(34) reductase QueG [Brevundimonas nasdae]QYC15819.1 tRNA epoxyqueuosine(34) reductase QueG [Brevundimonas nasdae]